MSPRIFSTTQREELRIKMLDAGFELIKQHGMTHASVEKRSGEDDSCGRQRVSETHRI